MSRRWPKVTLTGPEEFREAAASALLEVGALGAWESETRTAVYFPPEISETEVRLLVASVLSKIGAVEGLSWELDWEPEQDWMSGWRRYFRPIALGKRIIVKPPWGEIPSDWVDRDVVIEIEPKMAFGTGTHPSTQLVLEAEEELVHEGADVLDVGTGSGILAIAAVHLGARRVLAFDVDVTAVKNALENLRRNRVEERVQLYAGELEALSPDQRFDVVLANIRTGVHRGLLGRYRDHLRPGGRVVLSGILREEAAELNQLLRQEGLTVERVREREEWAAIEASAQNR
ncbi:MAG: 50S ribosomal protein L11 methyltransferase [Calditrichaeota bacterium]|nr:50S ribosomal protein L11 methyltransferase [Calditrichota bacterium]